MMECTINCGYEHYNINDNKIMLLSDNSFRDYCNNCNG